MQDKGEVSCFGAVNSGGFVSDRKMNYTNVYVYEFRIVQKGTLRTANTQHRNKSGFFSTEVLLKTLWILCFDSFDWKLQRRDTGIRDMRCLSLHIANKNEARKVPLYFCPFSIVVIFIPRSLSLNNGPHFSLISLSKKMHVHITRCAKNREKTYFITFHLFKVPRYETFTPSFQKWFRGFL